MSGKPEYAIEDVDQMRALASPMRQEIADTVNALGECSIAEIASALGVAADGLYYHVRALVDAGLLIHSGERNTTGRTEALYATPTGGIMRLKYDAADADNVKAITAIVSSMLRVAERDFGDGFRPDLARTEGPRRNIVGSRQKAWLDKEQRREVQRLLGRLQEIFADSQPAEGSELCSLTFVLSPIEPTVERPGGRRRKPRKK